MSTRTEEEHLVRANDVVLRVKEHGDGPPLVLVHGSLDDHRVWQPVEEALDGDFRVISYARRGHADSTEGTVPGRRRDDEDDLAALLGALDLAPAHVAANSYGAAVALGLATRRPELFRTLCVHEPPLLEVAADDPAVSSVRRPLDAIRSRIVAGEAEAAVREFVDDIVLGPGAWDTLGQAEQTGMVAAAGTFAEELDDPDWAVLDTDALARTRIPLLLTTGDASPPFLTAISRRLAETDSSIVVQPLSGAGHLPHVTHTSTYAAAIRDFVAASRLETRPDASGTFPARLRRHL